MSCLFCQIANGERDTPLLHNDEQCVAFKDIDPKAPHHILIIPKKHIATLNEIQETDRQMIGHLVYVATQLADQLKIHQPGYRVVMNCNKAGGQAVFHIHLHLLGGRTMEWPPG